MQNQWITQGIGNSGNLDQKVSGSLSIHLQTVVFIHLLHLFAAYSDDELVDHKDISLTMVLCRGEPKFVIIMAFVVLNIKPVEYIGA